MRFPTAHLTFGKHSERMRGRLVLVRSVPGLGALTGRSLAISCSKNVPRSVLALDVCHGHHSSLDRHHRPLSIPESAHWLLVRGRHKDAQAQIARLLARQATLSNHVNSHSLSLPSRRETLRRCSQSQSARHDPASVPWFLQDLGTYGIGIFTPTILAATLGHKTAHARKPCRPHRQRRPGGQGAGFIDLLLIVGIVCAILRGQGRASGCRSWLRRMRRRSGDRRLFHLRHRPATSSFSSSPDSCCSTS